MGIWRQEVMSYDRGAQATRSAYASVSRVRWQEGSAAFSAEDKAVAGDDYDREVWKLSQESEKHPNEHVERFAKVG